MRGRVLALCSYIFHVKKYQCQTADIIIYIVFLYMRKRLFTDALSMREAVRLCDKAQNCFHLSV